jgi:hypothetical protein
LFLELTKKVPDEKRNTALQYLHGQLRPRLRCKYQTTLKCGGQTRLPGRHSHLCRYALTSADTPAADGSAPMASAAPPALPPADHPARAGVALRAAARVAARAAPLAGVARREPAAAAASPPAAGAQWAVAAAPAAHGTARTRTALATTVHSARTPHIPRSNRY